jgi:hypothetical protein
VPQPQNPSPGKGAGVRAEYGLSYFDSLHATAAMSTGATLVSFDKRYAGIKGVSEPAPRACCWRSWRALKLPPNPAVRSPALLGVLSVFTGFH